MFLILFTLPQHGPFPYGFCSSACSSFSAPPLQTDLNAHTHTHTIHSPAYEPQHRWRPYSSRAHTHPLYSQTSRLLFTSLSLGTSFQGILSTFIRRFDYQNLIIRIKPFRLVFGSTPDRENQGKVASPATFPCVSGTQTTFFDSTNFGKILCP